MLCTLAVAAMEAFEQQHPGRFTWVVVDVSTREGVARLRELRPRSGRMIPVPGVVVDGEIVFDHIPPPDEFSAWLDRSAAGP
ncbi:MAG: hypothetical protein Kow0092_27870 [Deferrisomatales bacterium]